MLRSRSWIHTDSSADLVVGYLKAWEVYASDLGHLTDLRDPSQYPAIRQLLGFSSPRKRPRYGSALHVSDSSWMYGCAVQAQVRMDKKTSRGENLVAVVDLDKLIASRFTEHLEVSLMTLHSDLSKSSWLSPLGESDVVADRPPFEQTFRVFSFALAALHPIRKRPTAYLTGNLNTDVINIWVNRLFDLVFPPTGLVYQLSAVSRLPENESSCGIVHAWVQEHFASLKLSGKHPDAFLTMFITCISLSYELGNSLDSHLSALSCTKSPRRLIRSGCSVQPESIVTDLFKFFQPGSFRGISHGIYALRFVLSLELKLREGN